MEHESTASTDLHQNDSKNEKLHGRIWHYAVRNQDLTQSKEMRLWSKGKGEDKCPRSQWQSAIILISTW